MMMMIIIIIVIIANKQCKYVAYTSLKWNFLNRRIVIYCSYCQSLLSIPTPTPSLDFIRNPALLIDEVAKLYSKKVTGVTK